MDTWTDGKFSKRKFQSKSEKSYHVHMKQIILLLTILEFTWLIIDGFMKENGPVLLCQKVNLVPPKQKGPKKFEIFQAPSYKTWKNFLALRKKNICWVYTMENKDTNTDYQKVVRVGDQKWDCWNYIWNHFFVWDSYSLFFNREFSSPTWKKSPPLKVPILKNGSTPPSSPLYV